ncbi:mesenteric estrogen-dependent adipogenesis protein-like [Oncorhynchus keta]|uniref:mesenteric estrogen-dependent adipogenesis protein-like n=1 Tax=Oncorhynchus keta TaxID=8018 RepID=UPI0015FE2CA6|nr:mesenteric estrogen-dependent adipogenesis protein-like [Oncorhynchus keta]XP_052376392.1 mesenteric estrogen-dependent adipogenesis protein-like [Oncorhynchus keta]XP_052376393.1 mesenteric estrogen-dependent adipogenesis protein-like [Oncorhynchus keta]XP_052376394.1 mesenteric estrogen-dependent adipogenesis protein-like [Oncorhynchus keta]XP_052376395.1 mesenteric estrogen-dependent adipogenesis protein-like [Oncorhynchus keta]XP_052376396.1 mesenteric estrogen-dependent adipogenesis pr
MTITDGSRCTMEVIEVEEFLRNPPPGFTVEAGDRFVKSDPENCCVFIDDFELSRGGKVVFQHSQGKKITVRNLGDYTRFRKNLTSKKIYILVSACESKPSSTDKKAPKNRRVLQQYVVSIDGHNPLIKWEIERGLDRTISSVAGESYRVDIDLCDALRGWAGESFCLLGNREKVTPVWKDTCFTLKYYSDALFDFPHWLGFSKRHFKISYHGR